MALRSITLDHPKTRLRAVLAARGAMPLFRISCCLVAAAEFPIFRRPAAAYCTEKKGAAKKVNIRPGVSVLSVLRHLNYSPWFALAELVDNSRVRLARVRP